MSVLITMEVGPVDYQKLKGAMEWAESRNPKGHIASKLYRSESNPSTVLIIDEWDSHEDFHRHADAIGEEFNKRAGTDNLEWRDESWTPA